MKLQTALIREAMLDFGSKLAEYAKEYGDECTRHAPVFAKGCQELLVTMIRLLNPAVDAEIDAIPPDSTFSDTRGMN